VLKSLRNWFEDEETESKAAPGADSAEPSDDALLSKVDQRLSFRHDFCGHRVIIRDRRSAAFLHLKDLSCLGCTGLTDLPVAVGEIVFITLQKPRFHAAQVRWVKNAKIDLRFMRFLDPDLVEKVHRAHVARKASGRPLEEFLPSERGFYP
jgi:hypothetical protein